MDNTSEAYAEVPIGWFVGAASGIGWRCCKHVHEPFSELLSKRSLASFTELYPRRDGSG